MPSLAAGHPCGGAAEVKAGVAGEQARTIRPRPGLEPAERRRLHRRATLVLVIKDGRAQGLGQKGSWRDVGGAAYAATSDVALT